MGKTVNRDNHHYKDPSRLTPYEERMLELRKQGMTYKQIAEHMGQHSPGSILCRFRIIREKLEAQSYEQAS